MGACISKMKDIGAGLDKEAIEMGVKSRRVEISQKTKDLTTTWSNRIATGETINIAAAELLPQKDTKGIELVLNSQSTTKQMMTTALYVVTGTLFRDQMKKEIWADLAAGMKAKKLPAPVIEHGEKGAGPAIDMALDKQVEQMRACIAEDRPLISEEELRAVSDYKAKVAAQNPKKEEEKFDQQKMNVDVNQKPVQSGDVYVDASGKDGSAMMPGADGSIRPQFEQNQAIRTSA